MRKKLWSVALGFCFGIIGLRGGVALAAPYVLNPPSYTCAGSYPILLNTGSYILGNNFTLTCSNTAFKIIGDNVTLDLGGYTITGNGAGSGIGIDGSMHSNVAVKNGSVVKMGGGGISLGAS